MSNEFPSNDDKHPSIDFEKDAHGWIQWKGTQVCIDITCKCGESYHLDEEFMYHVKCSKCGRLYECGGNIKLYEIDPGTDLTHYFIMKNDDNEQSNNEEYWQDEHDK
jgi:hypothetical protein